MKYLNIIINCVCAIGGGLAGYYYGKQKEVKAYEADIASLKEEYQKKIDEAKKAGRMEMLRNMSKGPVDGEEQKLKENGDIDDEIVEVVSENDALDNPVIEDIIFFGKDKVWWNQDREKTYNNNDPFTVPTDFFTYFGEDKADLIYLHNTKTNEYFAVRYNPGSYVSNVLGYDDTSND